MAKFDYNSSLSPIDFQDLSADLLEARDGIRLERFGEGPDQGIDFRHIDANGHITIVQCKRFEKGAYSKLYNELMKSELEKIKRNNPARYILVTSVSMNPARKKKIVDALAPFCLNPNDIIGREQIDTLLEEHEEILKKNVKLWVPSFSIFSRIINNGIYSRSLSEFESIKKNLKYFVRHLGVANASKILDEKSVCIIAGIPGIGKTTLAEILILNLVRHGFELVKIDSNIQEAHAVWNPDPSKKQVFYYDDFLGRTSLKDSLEKNEDGTLLNFIKQVKESKNRRFILTTREYILQDAKEFYERLSGKITDFYKYILQVTDLDRSTKARILYNHLYFSEIGATDLKQIITGKSYLEIIDHQNYSPRIIHAMTIGFYERYGNDGGSYKDVFLRNLNNPEEVWKFPFYKHLDDYDRLLIILLWSLSERVFVNDLRKSFQITVAKKWGVTSNSKANELFEKSLRKLENSFIGSEKEGGEILISLYNPSVEDFLKLEVKKRPELLIELISTFIFFEQVEVCSRLLKEQGGDQANTLEVLLEKAHSLIFTLSSNSIKVVYSKTNFKIERRDVDICNRLILLFEIIESREKLDYDYCIKYSMTIFKKVKGNGHYNHSNADRFIEWWMETLFRRGGDGLFEELLESICLNLCEQTNNTDCFFSLGKIIKDYGYLVTAETKQRIDAVVDEFVEWSTGTDREDLEDSIGDLERVAELFERDYAYEIGELKEKLEEKNREEVLAERVSMDDDDSPGPRQEMPTEDIERMFSALEREKFSSAM